MFTGAIVRDRFFDGKVTMVFQLAYVSQSQPALEQRVLTNILDVSQRNNAKDKITGILMYHDEIFFQVLEGPKAAVEACYYDRICHDTRHKDPTLMWSDSVKSRTFSDWTMGYVGPDEIGKYTENAFQSLACLRDKVGASKTKKGVALELAQMVYDDFLKTG
jgi:hypothetical protein